MKKLLILLLIICSSKFLFGQKVEWIKKVNASYKQGLIPQYVHVDGKGNLNLIMNLNSKGVFGKDTVDSGLLAIPKYDTSGTLINLIVVKDTPLNLEVNALTIDKEGNHYLVGGFHKTKNPTSNYFLMKTNSLGKVIWRVQNYYGVSGQGISVDDKGNIFVSGYIKDSFSLDTFKYKNLNGSWNSFTARLDTSGKVKWVKFFHYSKGFTSSPKAMAHSHGNIIGDNGKLYVVGHAEAIASIDTFIVKDNNPNFFDKNYGILMCFDTSNGNVNFIVNDSLRMQEFYIYKDKRDNIYTSGSSNTCPSKFDFSGIRYEFIKSVNNGLTGINSDGNALILNKNITLTDSTGLIIGKSLSPFGTNSVKRILTDRYNQFYIYGFANDTIKFGGNKFFMENFIARITIYNPTTIIKEIEKPEQTSFYPNPCSTTLNITSNFQLNSIAFLINIQGEILSTITLTDGNNAINVSTLPKGIYLLKIQNKESVEVRKFVKE